MIRHSCFVESKCSSSRLVHQMIAFICLPFSLGQVRVFGTDRKHKIEYCLPLWTETRRIAIRKRLEVLSKLILEGLSRQDRKRIVHFTHIAVQKVLRGLQLWQVVGVNKEVDVHAVAIGPEAVGADLFVAKAKRV